MGKKNIAKKFAAVKRIISSQDDRMYSFYKLANKISKNYKNSNAKDANSCKNKPLTMSKSNKCTIYIILLVLSNLPASFSPTTQPSVHPTESSSIQTLSTFQSKTSSTSSKHPWTVYWVNVFLTLLIAS